MRLPQDEVSRAICDDGPGDIHLSESGGDNGSNAVAGPGAESSADSGWDGLTRAVTESGTDTLSPPDDGGTDARTDTDTTSGSLDGNDTAGAVYESAGDPDFLDLDEHQS